METPDLVTTRLKKTADRIKGTSALIKALLALTAVIIAGTGAVLLAVYEFPAKPEPAPVLPPVQQSAGQTVQPAQPTVQPTESVTIVREGPRIPTSSPTLDVAGTWRDDGGTTFTIQQTSSRIRLSMAGNSEIGIPFEMIGEGILNEQSVHMELEGWVLGQSTGTDKLPIDVTFVDNRNATISMSGIGVSGTFHRQ